jgi:ATP-dependent DNA helicase PIF1
MLGREPTDPALLPEDFALLEKWNDKVYEDTLETCNSCQERWFDMELQGGVCRRCQKDDAKRNTNVDSQQEPRLFSDENFTDPGEMPVNLPPLTQVEEMLIARVHTFIEVRQHRGQQFKYRGHVCNFMANVEKACLKLPRLPKDLEILILRPSRSNADPNINRQFERDYFVRRSAIEAWLCHLKRHHSGYQDVEIDLEALSQLPEDGTIEPQLPVIETPEEPITSELEELEEAEVSMVPDLQMLHQEEDLLRRDIQQRPQQQPPQFQALTMPSVQSTPIDEHGERVPYMSLAFPTLFPFGKGDFVEPRRVRPLTFSDWCVHLLKYKDGRFARHPRFRYAVFNTLLRKKVHQSSGFFVSKYRPDGELTGDDIRRAFQENTPYWWNLPGSCYSRAYVRGVVYALYWST